MVFSKGQCFFPMTLFWYPRPFFKNTLTDLSKKLTVTKYNLVLDFKICPCHLPTKVKSS